MGLFWWDVAHTKAVLSPDVRGERPWSECLSRRPAQVVGKPCFTKHFMKTVCSFFQSQNKRVNCFRKYADTVRLAWYTIHTRIGVAVLCQHRYQNATMPLSILKQPKHFTHCI